LRQAFRFEQRETGGRRLQMRFAHRAAPSACAFVGRIAVRWVSLLSSLMRRRQAKSRSTKPRSRSLIVVCVVAFAVLLLLLRMLVFVYGHGRR